MGKLGRRAGAHLLHRFGRQRRPHRCGRGLGHAGDRARRSRSLGLDPESYLDDNDSYHFFEKLGGLIITGPTQTNVMDLRFILVGK